MHVLGLTRRPFHFSVYDPVGMLVPSLKCIAWNGRLLVIGFAAGQIEKVPANLLLLKSASVIGVFWGGIVKNEPELPIDTWMNLLQMFQDGRLRGSVYEQEFK